MLFCLSGVSGSGKDTIKSGIGSYRGIIPLVYYTTRPIRPGEVDGREYNFSTEDDFQKELQDGNILEYREYNANFGHCVYYTLCSQLSVDKNYIVTSSIDQSVKYIDALGRQAVCPIYISVDEYMLLNRLLTRTQFTTKDYTEMCRRFLDDRETYNKYRFMIGSWPTVDNSGDLDNCIANIKKVIDFHLSSKENLCKN